MIEIYVSLPKWMGYLIAVSLCLAGVSSVLSIYVSYLNHKLRKLKERAND